MKTTLTIIIRIILIITFVLGLLYVNDKIQNYMDDKACASQERGYGHKIDGDRCIIFNGGGNQTSMGIKTARQAQSIGYKF